MKSLFFGLSLIPGCASQNDVAIAQAQAAIEAAKAAQGASAATQIAVASQGMVTILLALIVLLLLGIAALSVYAFVVLPKRTPKAVIRPAGRWKPGPDARWQRQGSSLPAQNQDDLFRQALTQQWYNDQLSKALLIPKSEFPPQTVEEEDDWSWLADSNFED